MTTATELKTRILSRVNEDGDFRARLIADPKAAISAEIGATIPEGLDVVVHEDSATTAHLVLSPSPQLSESELEIAVGGSALPYGHPIGAPGETA
jgi:hypothetical protein